MKKITALVLTCVFMLSAVFAVPASASVAAPPAPTDFKVVITERETSSSTKDRVYISASWKMVAGADGYGLSHATKAWNDSEAESSGLLKTTVGGVDRRGFDINFLCGKSTSSADAVKSFNFSVGAYEHDGEEHVYSTKVYSPAITDDTGAAAPGVSYSDTGAESGGTGTTTPPSSTSAASSERFYSSIGAALMYGLNKEGEDLSILFQSIPGNALTITGVMLEKDGWVYYRTGHDVSSAAIYRIRTDGTGNTKLATSRFAGYTSSAMYFGAEGDWIYYSAQPGASGSYFNLYRERADGTENATVLAARVYDFYVADDGYIYYISIDEDYAGRMYRIKGDGTGKQFIADAEYTVDGLAVSGGWIYYVLTDGSVCKMKTDGSGETVIKSGLRGAHLIKAGNGMIIYDYNARLYKMNTDGSGQTDVGLWPGVGLRIYTPAEIIFNGGAAYVLVNNYSGGVVTAGSFTGLSIYKTTPGSTAWETVASITDTAGAASSGSSAPRAAAPSVSAPRAAAPAVSAPAPQTRQPQQCFTCGGDGRVDCSACDGTGELLRGSANPVSCHACGGIGWRICGTCFGSGTIR